jgi:hypothetical protein
MKKNYIKLLAILLSIFTVSCDKNAVQEIDSPITGGAQIKFFNFGASSPSVNFYANEVKMSATSSTTGVESANGVAYGSVFPSSTYSLIKGGAYTFKGTTSATALVDPNVTVATLSATVEDGKFYSLYTSGLFNATAKTIDAFIVEDKLPATDNTAPYARFVNGISNAASAMDLIAKNTATGAETVVGSAVAYKSASEFVKLTEGVYELFARYPGSSANTISRNGTSVVSFVAGKVYTISSRGDITITGTTAVNRPFLDNTTNR